MKNYELINPKRNLGKLGKEGWYNYYAGFSHAFVKDAIDALETPEDAIILDPWNGGGTTTLVASQEGFRSIGIDLNPAMVVIAKAKLANHDEIVLALKKVKSLRVNFVQKRYIADNDYLLHWFDFDTANYLRYIDGFISGKKWKSFDKKAESLHIISCVIYLGLFELVRELIKKFIPSNPTWVKKARGNENKLSATPKDIKNALSEKLIKLLHSQSEDHVVKNSNILCASSKSMPLDERSVDLIITSPPYCTRIDYGVATSPELAILAGYDPEWIDLIRRNLTGRTTIDSLAVNEVSFGKVVDKFLMDVKSHSSIASSTYYYKNLLQYFIDLKISMFEIRKVLKLEGSFVCVVQDSHYKDVYCDLAAAIIEMAENQGFYLKSRNDFNASLNMANINSSAKKYRDKSPAVESVLIFN